MNIKECIGQRIIEARKAKGLTQKALAELTDDLKQSRINNWEQGIRTPGPEAIKQLSKALDVSAAYLMCLTENKQLNPLAKNPLGVLLPLLNHKQACNPRLWINAIKNNEYGEELSFIPLSPEAAETLGENAFALIMADDSMEPELRLNDILIIDPDTKPKPGHFVVAKFDESEIVIRRYKQLSAAVIQEFELSAINTNWAPIQNSTTVTCVLIGTVKSFYRQLIPK